MHEVGLRPPGLGSIPGRFTGAEASAVDESSSSLGSRVGARASCCLSAAHGPALAFLGAQVPDHGTRKWRF